MKISVVTAAFNSGKTIERNILSVIGQTYQNYEHIIIDNISSDNTLWLAKDIYNRNGASGRLVDISEKDEGISDAFNKGIQAASGDIVAILNSDDVYYDNTVFEKVIKAFEETGVWFVHGDMFFDDPVYGSNVRKPLLCPVTTAMPYNHPSMFFLKQVYVQYGMFDISYKYAMDHELIIRYNKLVPDFAGHGEYIKGSPLVKMYSGGTSWNYELKAIEESKIALIKNGMWDSNAKKQYMLRVYRTRLKKYLNMLGLNFIVKLWRKKKWG